MLDEKLRNVEDGARRWKKFFLSSMLSDQASPFFSFSFSREGISGFMCTCVFVTALQLGRGDARCRQG